MPDADLSSPRDRLALRRTHLANERTVLAYSRTAIMLAASGVTLLKLGPVSDLDRWLAGGLIAAAAVMLVVSGRRFLRLKREIGD